MSRAAFRPALVVVALFGATWPASLRAEPKEVTLPRLEVPDDVAKGTRPGTRPGARPDRSALLNQTIELTDERDRRTLAREQMAWRRLSGSLCAGCGTARSAGRVVTVVPIAVLNARPASVLVAARPAPGVVAAAATAGKAVTARRTARTAHAERVQFAKHRGPRSRFATYLGRVRYAFLRWRRHHHHVRRHHRIHR